MYVGLFFASYQLDEFAVLWYPVYGCVALSFVHSYSIRGYVICLQVTLIEFLTCSKLLLQKARSALIDGQRSASTDTGAPSSSMATSLSANSLVTPAAANRSSLSSANTTGSSGSTNRTSITGTAAAAVMGSTNNANTEIMDREREQYHNWQREMESAFRSLLRTMKPYFADWHDSDVLHALQRDMNDC